jgi:hypothetical protein
MFTHAGEVDARASIGADGSSDTDGRLVVVTLEIALLGALHIIGGSSEVGSSVGSLAVLSDGYVAILINWLISDPANSILPNISRHLSPWWGSATINLTSTSHFFFLIIVLVGNNVVEILHFLILIKLLMLILWEIIRKGLRVIR